MMEKTNTKRMTKECANCGKEYKSRIVKTFDGTQMRFCCMAPAGTKEQKGAWAYEWAWDAREILKEYHLNNGEAFNQ